MSPEVERSRKAFVGIPEVMKSLINEVRAAAPSCTYWIDGQRQLLIEEYSGNVAWEDLRRIAMQAVSDSEGHRVRHRLMDFGAADLSMSGNETMRLALLMRGGRFDGWHAFVVKDRASFAVVRMLSQWARVGDRSRIFYGRREAGEWLDQMALGGMHPLLEGRRVA